MESGRPCPVCPRLERASSTRSFERDSGGVTGSFVSSARKHHRPHERENENSHSKSERDDAHPALLELS